MNIVVKNTHSVDYMHIFYCLKIPIILKITVDRDKNKKGLNRYCY